MRKIVKPIIKLTAVVSLFILSITAHSTTINSMEAYLFHKYSGTFSENIIGRKDLILWNAVIGEGDVKEPSDSFLLKIGFTGKPDTFKKTNIQLTIKKKKSNEVVFFKIFNDILFSHLGVSYQAFMIKGYNCDPLIISVGEIQEELEFHCGE